MNSYRNVLLLTALYTCASPFYFVAVGFLDFEDKFLAKLNFLNNISEFLNIAVVDLFCLIVTEPYELAPYLFY